MISSSAAIRQEDGEPLLHPFGRAAIGAGQRVSGNRSAPGRGSRRSGRAAAISAPRAHWDRCGRETGSERAEPLSDHQRRTARRHDPPPPRGCGGLCGHSPIATAVAEQAKPSMLVLGPSMATIPQPFGVMRQIKAVRRRIRRGRVLGDRPEVDDRERDHAVRRDQAPRRISPDAARPEPRPSSPADPSARRRPPESPGPAPPASAPRMPRPPSRCA